MVARGAGGRVGPRGSAPRWQAALSAVPACQAHVETSLDGALVVNEHGIIVLFNGEAERMFGYCCEDLLGEKIKKLVPWHLVRAHRAHRDAVMEAAEGHQMGVNEGPIGVRKDGSEFPIEVSRTPVWTDAEGDLILVVCRDVTQQRQARAGAERLKGDFMATVSHELRTPLTSLLGYGEMMEELPDLPVEARRFLEVMMRSARRELTVVSDLLTMTVIDSGKLVANCAPLDLRHVAHRALEQSQVQAACHGITLGAEVSEVPVPVSGDEAKLLDAVSRLVHNSVMLTATGGQVTLRVCSTDGEGHLDVVDHGPGIPGPDRPLVFDRLYRTMTARRGEVPGVGVGLTIAKAIVEAQGGTLRIRESSAAGTVFRLALPLSPRVDHLPHQGTALSTSAAEAVRRATRSDLGAPADREDSTQAKGNPLSPACRLYLEAAISGRSADALKIVREAVRGRESPVDLYVDIFQSALYEVGRRWQTAGLTIAEEHMATATTQFILSVLHEDHPRTGSHAGTAVVTGVANEQHVVGASIVANVLHAEGWDVRFVGTNLPHDAIVSAIESSQATLVAISVTMSDGVADARDLIAHIRRSSATPPRIIVGGAAFNRDPHMWRTIGADGFAVDARSIADLTRSCPLPAGSGRGRLGC